MTLPTQKELAEFVHAQIVEAGYARSHTHHAIEACPVREVYERIADALLARLAPAWDGMTQEYERNLVSLADACDALRADLRACAEALTLSQEDLHHTLDHKTQECLRCAVNAALARPGVREALRRDQRG